MPEGSGTARSGDAIRHDAEALAGGLPHLMIEAVRVASTVAQGVHGRRRAGQGDAFWQYRHFRSGDPSQRIDWRRSARSDALYVREREWEAAQTAWIWCDRSPSMRFRSDTARAAKDDRARVLALALAILLIEAGERVAIAGAAEPPSASRAAIRRIGTRLLAPDQAELPPDQAIPRHASFVWIGDGLAPADEIAKAITIRGGRGIGGAFLHVLDPAEEDWPFAGRVRFEGLGEPLGLLVGRAETLKSGYQARLAAHRAAIRDACSRAGWSYIAHRSDRPADLALLSLYAALAPRAADRS